MSEIALFTIVNFRFARDTGTIVEHSSAKPHEREVARI